MLCSYAVGESTGVGDFSVVLSCLVDAWLLRGEESKVGRYCCMQGNILVCWYSCFMYCIIFLQYLSYIQYFTVLDSKGVLSMVGSVWKQMVILVPDRVLVRFIRWSFFASISTHFPPFFLVGILTAPTQSRSLFYFIYNICTLFEEFFTYF